MNHINLNYRFPYEIVKFLTKKDGTSLIIKGPAGAGKTTLALQILDSLQDKYKIAYLSTRVGDESLYQQFPWIRNMEKNLKLIISSKEFLTEIFPQNVEEKPVREKARKVLDQITGAPPTKVSWEYLTKFFREPSLPEIKRVYNQIEMNLPNKTIVVIDSIEGISSINNIDLDLFVFALHKDLAENSGASLIFVSEKNQPGPEDYITDGVIYLDNRIQEGRRIRTMSLNKLRGVEIMTSNHMFTLCNGKFYAFYPNVNDSKGNGIFEPIRNSENVYSTGIRDLDEILDGGIEPSSFLLLDIGKDVTRDDYALITRLMFLNFMHNNLGIMYIPPPGANAFKVKEDLCRFIPEDIFNRKFRHLNYTIEESEYPYIVAAGAKDPVKNQQNVIKAMMDISLNNEPIVHVYCLETLDAMRGYELTIKDILNSVSTVKSTKDIAIITSQTEDPLKEKIRSVADYHFKIESLNNVPVIYGIKPRTIYYIIEVDREKGFPNIKLIPML